MLDTVDFNMPQPDKQQYKDAHDELMDKLVVLQQRAVAEGAGLVVLFEGWNGAGKGSRISDLMYNLDARATSVYVSPDINSQEVKDFAGHNKGVSGFFPMMQEYWKALGERGHITFYDRGWYTKAMQLMMAKSEAELLLPQGGTRHYLESISDFERQLTRDGYVVVKFFVHVSKKAQKKRLDRLYDDKATRWRVPDKKLASVKDYESAYKLYDRLLEGSNYDFAPWVLVNGEDKRSANLLIARTLVDALENALARKQEAANKAAEQTEALKTKTKAAMDAQSAGAQYEENDANQKDAEAIAIAQHSFAPAQSRFEIVANHPTVDTMKHNLVLPQSEYKKELKHLQSKLFKLENLMFQARIPLILMYEGWDAAGKGGNIKRVAQALDARAYTIFPSPAPTKPELAHPHLWRYWTRLPKAGHVGMYDRSWYGRVLVERVEEITPPDAWAAGYDEINEFEHDLVDWGAILLKFWVDVSPEEQLARFEARAADPAKQWKITPDDWRNREKYPQYKSAIDDMFRLTSTSYAPWTVLESDDKRYARVKALRIIVGALEERLN
ncbi:polyphosphate--AMP phosphotransferase [Adlercreutzia sp. ZJ154]|uniref:polyphosphate--AMP phosphotransferase n=1 Tax=Adlercreutzia sp. ZJ154 TaxID=2709790 RepID=UPI0013EB9E2B|nr:polyphosphate--AMP phosphotransferase [Adlercreutzia sp. ZJ154]